MPEGWADDEDDPEHDEDEEDACPSVVSDIWRSRIEDLGDNPQSR